MTLECTSTANIVNSATLAKCKYETTIQSPYKNQTCHLHLESCSKSNIHTITENYLPYSHTISLKNNHQKKKQPISFIYSLLISKNHESL